ncbi:ATP-binding protein [Halobellus rarus]|uniref:ATP-binding protein n=1 Tax=Halobellus rarus TaxID=1126237 RepID=A0ABD6CK48_9EURY|nr:helicase HerA-like domain-containing protein [Halobellus rarus]
MHTEVLGRSDDGTSAAAETSADRVAVGADAAAFAGTLGHHRARDGSRGAPVAIDFDRPHAALVVGKRGYGKSYTLGVLVEEATRTPGVAPVVIDPMGVFRGLAADAAGDLVPARVIDDPTIRADAIPPARWPALVGTDPDRPVGALVWHAAETAPTLDGMRETVADSDAGGDVRRAAANRLRRAAEWNVFDPAGPDARALADGAATVLDCSGLDDAPSNAVAAGVAAALYDARLGRPSTGETDTPGIDRLPWLFIDEAHVFFQGVASASLRAILTRGRAPGVSLVAATQRPSALPEVAVSQSDLRVVHRLTAGSDVRALAAADPSYLDADLAESMPTAPGEALVVDDTAEATRTVAVRTRDTPHGGSSPRASAAARAIETAE